MFYCSTKIKSIFILIIICISNNSYAFTTIRETVKTVDNIKIEIEVIMPDRSGKFPVLFFVHGGGWDHGTTKQTPGPLNLSSAKMMCDELGVVFIGVDYRCKNQNGDFDKALQDVMDVYSYAKKNSKRLKCDFKKIGFAGASAGTPLSAVAAQKITACKLYIGIYGKYDFMNKNLGGYWPNQQTLEKFKIVTHEEKKRASAIAQIRKNSPAILLIHGDGDETIGFRQSIAFADSVKLKGYYAKTYILPHVQHGFYKPSGKEAFVNSSIEIMDHLIQFFKLQNINKQAIISSLNQSILDEK